MQPPTGATVILLTHNRPQRLSRTLAFIAAQLTQGVMTRGGNLAIQILDSSDKDIRTTNYRQIQVHDWPIEVKHAFCSERDIYHKYSNGLLATNSEFVCTIGDDDFLSLEGLHHALEFLRRNQDFASANGQIYRYNPSTELQKFAPYPQRGASNELSCARVEEFFRGRYTATVYTVFRTYPFAERLQDLAALPVGRHVKERLLAVALLTCGKRAVLPGPFLGREKSGLTGHDEFGTRFHSASASAKTFGYEHSLALLENWLQPDAPFDQCIDEARRVFVASFLRYRSRLRRRRLRGLAGNIVPSFAKQIVRNRQTKHFPDLRLDEAERDFLTLIRLSEQDAQSP